MNFYLSNPQTFSEEPVFSSTKSRELPTSEMSSLSSSLIPHSNNLVGVTPSPNVPPFRAANSFISPPYFTGNFFTTSPPPGVIQAPFGERNVYIIHNQYGDAFWLAVWLLRHQVTINDQIIEACKHYNIPQPPILMRLPVSLSYNPLRVIFTNRSDASRVLRRTQAMAIEAVAWLHDIHRRFEDLSRNSLPTSENPLLDFYRLLCWPNSDPGNSSNTCRSLILHPARDLSPDRPYNPSQPTLNLQSSVVPNQLQQAMLAFFEGGQTGSSVDEDWVMQEAFSSEAAEKILQG